MLTTKAATSKIERGMKKEKITIKIFVRISKNKQQKLCSLSDKHYIPSFTNTTRYFLFIYFFYLFV
jgi:hypothetical protein